MNPPLPGATFGNLWSLANTTETPSETSPNPDNDLVFQLRTSIREINAEYAKALQNEKWHSEHLLKWHERFGGEGEAEFLEFTSWCRFPIYEVDFGWGKPVWACTTTFPYKNFIVLMSTKCGDGIEAWINIGEEDDDIYMGAGSGDSRKNLQHPAIKKTFPAAHAVNLRARMNPPLPDATFGNLWSLATTVTPSDEAAQGDLVFQLRTSIRQINAEYVEALQNGKGHSERLRKWHEIMFSKGEAEFCKFSSWCRFPIYEVDFGWGRPVWACTATVPYKNVVRMMSTKCAVLMSWTPVHNALWTAIPKTTSF
nr:vinorine synthase-like [Ipomoea batatas]